VSHHLHVCGILFDKLYPESSWESGLSDWKSACSGETVDEEQVTNYIAHEAKSETDGLVSIKRRTKQIKSTSQASD